MGCGDITDEINEQHRQSFAKEPKVLTTGDLLLRDYFAAAALMGIMNSGTLVSAALRPKDCAKIAYEHADAMLTAREK